MKKISDAITKIFDVVFPMIANYKTNKKLKEKLNTKNEADEEMAHIGGLSSTDNSHNIDLNILKERYEDTLRIKDKLEDKAKTNIIGISISITLIMGASGVLSVLNGKYPFSTLSWVLFALFVISVAYMLIAGLLVIHLLVNENIVDIINIELDKKVLKNNYCKCISQNQNRNIIRNNYVFTSYECIRNSLICLFVILIFVAIPFSYPRNNPEEVMVHASQAYSFVFSSSAVDYLTANNVRFAIESDIISEIESAELNGTFQTFGIINDSNRLFIKFKVKNNYVEVLLIEPYTI